MLIRQHKVFAYITHGDRLLVFSHPNSPEAGIQVPAGTLKNDERPEDGVMREALEETGLTDLAFIGFLGEVERDMSDFGLDQIHHRRFYHLRCEGDPLDTWRHAESDPSDGSTESIVFEFFWAPMPDGITDLIASHGDMLPVLFEKMAQSD